MIAEGNLEREGDAVRQRVDIETESLDSPDRRFSEPVRVRLNIYTKDAPAPEDTEPHGSPDLPITATSMRLLRYGQRVRFAAELISPRNFRNPGAFDYVSYLREQGISATASVRFGGIELLPGFSGSRLGHWRARVHRSIVDRIHRLWPEPTSDLIAAMAIGERAFVERNERLDFQRTGTYHALVVAGLHIGILAGFVLWLLRCIGLGDLLSSACAMTLVFSYAAVTGEGPPVWRAALMFAVYLVTRLLYRRHAMLNAISIAALCLLASDPALLFTASFQMTVLCVALIAGIALPVLEHTIQPFIAGLRNLDALAYDRALPAVVAQFRIDLRILGERLSAFLPHWLAQVSLLLGFRCAFAIAGLSTISAAMQFGLALPMAYYFHRATAVALVANLMVVPLMELLMPAAALAIAISYASLWIATLPAALAAFALSGIAQSVHWLGGIRAGDLRLATPDKFVVAASAGCIVAAVLAVRRGKWSIAASVGFLLVSSFSVWKVYPRPDIQPGVLEVTALDVGQGDAILLALPAGGKVLVDAGGFPFWTHSQMDIGEDVVSPYLWSRGITGLDAVVLTHAHEDHMGGLPSVIANFHPRELWLPEGLSHDEIPSVIAATTKYNVKLVELRAGDAFDLSGAKFRVLAPDPGFPVRVSHRNDESLVMKISVGKTSALLEADAEKGTERLVSTEQPGADLLKVAHHGSASSTEEALLAAVHPQFAVISVGARNVYHHPRAQVLDRLEKAGVSTYRTDINGGSTFYLDGQRVIPAPPR